MYCGRAKVGYPHEFLKAVIWQRVKVINFSGTITMYMHWGCDEQMRDWQP